MTQKIISLYAPMGVGKTTYAETVARRYETLGYKVLILKEEVDTNIHLGVDNYLAQLHYATTRLDKLKELKFNKYDIIIEDSCIELDLAYMSYYKSSMTQKQLVKLSAIYRLAKSLYPIKRELLYLKMPIHEMKDQVQHRGREVDDLSSRLMLHIISKVPKSAIATPLRSFIGLHEEEVGYNTCNKYIVRSRVVTSDNQIVSYGFNTRIKTPAGENCNRKRLHGSDSNKFRNHGCAGIHSEVVALNKLIGKKLKFHDLKIYVTAHPCWDCAKYMVYLKDHYNLGISEVHYITPTADPEVIALLEYNDIAVYCWDVGGSIGHKDY